MSAIGKNSSISGKIGSWMVLAEYNNDGICVLVKSIQIDGKEIKEDTFYKLKNGEFVITE